MTPTHAITVRTYAELRQFAQAFAAGQLNLLMLIGEAGLAKSQTLRRVLPSSALWVEGNATAFGIFTALYHHRDQLVVIDDVDSLYSDRAAVRLLKCLCQTDPTKNVSWHSAAARLKSENIPQAFVTSSRVCIIANDWKTLDANTAAVQDRGHLIVFQPAPDEVHREVGKWFTDRHIYEWFGRHLHLVPNLSMRMYIRAKELADAGINWVPHLLRDIPERARIVAEILADKSHPDERSRVIAFQHRTGASRATYFNWKKKLGQAA